MEPPNGDRKGLPFIRRTCHTGSYLTCGREGPIQTLEAWK